MVDPRLRLQGLKPRLAAPGPGAAFAISRPFLRPATPLTRRLGSSGLGLYRRSHYTHPRRRLRLDQRQLLVQIALSRDHLGLLQELMEG
jgi:hypothetical protein